MINKYKILKNKILNYLSYSLMIKHSFGKPIIREIELTNACVMDCLMCPRKNMTRKVEYMDLNLFKNIIDQANWNSHIRLYHFGDPLLHPQLFDMIKYTSQKGIYTWISTNPKFLTKENSNKLIDSGLNHITISLDGINDKTYKYFRGKNANYNEAVKNIKIFLKTKIEKKSAIHVGISFIKMKLNKNDSEKFKKIWSTAKGLNEVSITPLRAYDNTDKIMLAQGDKDTYSERFLNGRDSCSEPWSEITILVDGRVVPCCYDYDGKYIIGDLREELLESVWNNSRAMALREQIRKKTFNNPLCINCRERMRENFFIHVKQQLKNLFSKNNKDSDENFYFKSKVVESKLN